MPAAHSNRKDTLMAHARNSKADQLAATHAVSSLITHHRIKVTPTVRKAMISLHLSATRAERRRKNTKSDAERIRDHVVRRVLVGRPMPSANDIASATKLVPKVVHAHLAMMKKRAKKK